MVRDRTLYCILPFWNKVHAENTELQKKWLHFARKKGVSPVNSQIVMN